MKGSLLVLSIVLLASTAEAQTSSSPAPTESTASPAPAAGAAPRYTIVSRTLANGMRVVYSPQPSTARAVVWVSWNVGSANDPDGYHGLAHFLEHMLFRGTRHVRSGDFARRLQRAGSSDLNGITGPDRTDYYEVVPAEQLPLALWLESDRIAFGADALTTQAVDTERRVVLNEFALHTGAIPGGLAPHFLSRELYPAGHPYYDLGDLGDDLQIITPAHLAWFFQTYYAPSNATLLIAGDFDITATEPLVESLFGSIRGGSHPPRPTRLPLERATQERRVRVVAEVNTQTVVVAWNTPAFLEPGDAELDLVADLLAGSDESLLYRRLVASDLARSVTARQESEARGSRFKITVSLDRGASIAGVVRIINDAIAEIRSGRIDPDALEDARFRFITFVLQGVGDPLRRAEAMSRYMAFLGEADGFERDAGRYRALGAAEVRRAARRWLRPEARVVETVEYDRGAPIAGRVDGAGSSSE